MCTFLKVLSCYLQDEVNILHNSSLKRNANIVPQVKEFILDPVYYIPMREKSSNAWQECVCVSFGKGKLGCFAAENQQCIEWTIFYCAMLYVLKFFRTLNENHYPQS